MDAKLHDAGSHLFHGFSIRRHEALLDKGQLEAGGTTGLGRKRSQVVQAKADELQRLHGLDYRGGSLEYQETVITTVGDFSW